MQITNGFRVSTITDHGIYGFFGEMRFLSNFHILPEPIIYDGFPFYTTEAAYMSGKTFDLSVKQALSDLSSNPGKTKRIGRTLALRHDWEQDAAEPIDVFFNPTLVKDRVMYDVLRLKFKQPEMALLLANTKNKHLEETNNWGDQYWGAAVVKEGFPGIGKNMLGKMLMSIRFDQASLISY